MRIGILEDDPVICGMLHEMLERHGHVASTYRDGWDFLAEITGEEPLSSFSPFDVVLIDLLLPGSISGIQAIQHLRTASPDLPIVVISAVPSCNLEQVKSFYPEVKALRKPFKMQDLLTMIEA